MGVMSSLSISEFVILKAFLAKGRSCNAHSIKEVTWIPPICGWIKCNTDGASRGSLGDAACGGLLRDSNGAILGCFSNNVGISYALNTELLAAMIAR